ncbi:hypothetical protein [Caballeronia arvi]|uniref:hypothetical protein n=1 Tax=Caballeronia arvi TaxID=1777135 RepID=UPI001F24A656|nr:hypothetical protein [Caballeronia arvi]
MIATLATLTSCVYVGLFLAGRSLLPEFLFRDAEKIQAQMDGAGTYDGSSFDAVGKFYAMFSPALLSVFVMAIGIAFIWAILARVKRAGSLGVALLLAAPCVFFNLFVSSKDTLVVAMSLLIVWTFRRNRPAFTLLAAIGCYLTYALLVRKYFLVILAIALFAEFFKQRGLRSRFVLLVACVLALALMPSEFYFALLNPRDMAVDYLVYQSPFGARTGFYNLLPPESFAAFCVDYIYAMVRLHLPVLFSPDPRGLAMQAFVILAWISTRSLPGPAKTCWDKRLLASLVLGHMAVSMLFEPDLGSYVRHLSSVSLFCMISLSARVDALRIDNANQRDAA